MYIYFVKSLAHIECYNDCSRREAIWLNLFAMVMLIGCQSGMDVRMTTPINQLFNDESIAVHILFLDVYT